jgi:hypothetical protein
MLVWNTFSTVVLELLTAICKAIVDMGAIPDSLKLGILTPIYKKKGDKHKSSSYCGITVMPVISTIIETILRDHLRVLAE